MLVIPEDNNTMYEDTIIRDSYDPVSDSIGRSDAYTCIFNTCKDSKKVSDPETMSENLHNKFNIVRNWVSKGVKGNPTRQIKSAPRNYNRLDDWSLNSVLEYNVGETIGGVRGVHGVNTMLGFRFTKKVDKINNTIYI